MRFSYLVPALFVLVATDMAAAQVSCKSVLSQQGVARADTEYVVLAGEISSLRGRINELGHQKETLESVVHGTLSYYGSSGKRRDYGRLKYDIYDLNRKLTKVKEELELEDDGGDDSAPNRLKISKLDNEKRYLERQLQDAKDIREASAGVRLFYGKRGLFDEPVRRAENQIEQNQSEKRRILDRAKNDRSKIEAEIRALRMKQGSLRSGIEKKTAELELLKKEIEAGWIVEKKNAAKELKKINAQLDQTKAQLAVSNDKFTPVQEKERVRMVKVLSDMQSNPELGDVVTDRLGYLSAVHIPRDQKVTILTGDLSQVSAKQKKQLTILIEKAMERGYYIVYDASSKSADFMSEITQEFGIGVLTSSKTKLKSSDSKVVISNKYLRMQLFAESAAVISTPESTVALDMIMNGLLTHVLDASKTFEYNIENRWKTRAKFYDGLVFRDPEIVPSAKQVLTPSDVIHYGGRDHKSPFDGLPEVKSEIVGFESLELNGLSLRGLQEIAKELASSKQ